VLLFKDVLKAAKGISGLYLNNIDLVSDYSTNISMLILRCGRI